jgi:hypothetical protein
MYAKFRVGAANRLLPLIVGCQRSRLKLPITLSCCFYSQGHAVLQLVIKQGQNDTWHERINSL